MSAEPCSECAGNGTISCCPPDSDAWCGRCDSDGLADCLTCRGTGRQQ